VYSASAELYDLIHAQFKDYPAEVDMLATLIRAEHPGAATILDVACGTGEHARLLRDRHGFSADGLDLDPNFVKIAGAKLGEGSVFQADMTEFSLGKRYDVVLCLFSSIGYVLTLERVIQTLQRFRAHLADGGLILVEPWFAPGGLENGFVSIRTAETPEVSVCRMGHTEIDGGVSRLNIEYLVGTASGIEHLREVHELGLFTTEEMAECFRAAGLDASYDPEGPYGRGLFIARAA
jgi:SAM-dependent methyltransferase